MALAPDESFLLVAQTAGYDILRIPLTGPAAGRPGPFASNLPGLPDNMTAAGDGIYWVAFPSPRLPLIDRVMPHPAPRRVAASSRGSRSDSSPPRNATGWSCAWVGTD
jgi:sugar lactone lactonase YvrE